MLQTLHEHPKESSYQHVENGHLMTPLRKALLVYFDKGISHMGIIKQYLGDLKNIYRTKLYYECEMHLN